MEKERDASGVTAGKGQESGPGKSRGETLQRVFVALQDVNEAKEELFVEMC